LLGALPDFVNYHYRMTMEEARQAVVDGINYAAYKETDSSLYDSDKNRLFGSEHNRSDRVVVKPSPWAEGDFEGEMAVLLRWANALKQLRSSLCGGSEPFARWRFSYRERYSTQQDKRPSVARTSRGGITPLGPRPCRLSSWIIRAALRICLAVTVACAEQANAGAGSYRRAGPDSWLPLDA
jgi:hypothetical protein